MDPLDDFEHQVTLSGFALAGHALRVLDKAGLLDEEARASIRGHLELLSEKMEAVDDADQPIVARYLDILVHLLPPPRYGDG